MDFKELELVGKEMLGVHSRARTVEIRQSFYGTSIRLIDEESNLDAHVKWNPPCFAKEADVLGILSRAGACDRFPQVLASSPCGCVVATRSCGSPLRELIGASGLSDGRATALLRDALLALAQAQSASSPQSVRSLLIDAGAAQMGSSELPGQIEAMGRGGLEDSEMDAEAARRLARACQGWLPMAEELAGLGIGDCWDHGDFGCGNVLSTSGMDGRAVIIDASEAAIANPCFSATQFCWRLGGHLGIEPGSALHVELRDHWERQASERLGEPHASISRGWELCSGLWLAYGLLVSRRFARAHRLATGAPWKNPLLSKLLSKISP